MYLRMYLASTLVDEITLNYNGLQSAIEREWYLKGLLQYLYETHEELIDKKKMIPSFYINDGKETNA